MMSNRVMRGLSDEKGSWKIICISRRRGRSSDLRKRGHVQPTCLLACGTGSGRWSACRRAGCSATSSSCRSRFRPPGTVSRRGMVKVTSSTARTWPTTRRKSPLRMGKYLRRFLHFQDQAGRYCSASSGSAVGSTDHGWRSSIQETADGAAHGDESLQFRLPCVTDARHVAPCSAGGTGSPGRL